MEWLTSTSAVYLSLLVFVAILVPFLTGGLRSYQQTYVAVRGIYVDFSKGRFYNPLKRSPVVIIRSTKQFTELSESPDLSQKAVFSDLFDFSQTLDTIPAHEPLALRPRLYGRVLHVIGPTHFPSIQHVLQEHVETRLAHSLSAGKVIEDGSTLVHLAPLIKDLTLRTMAILYFGKNLCQDPEFGSAIMQYPTDILRIMAFQQLTPQFMAPLVRKIVSRNNQARKVLVKRMAEIFVSEEAAWDEADAIKKCTVLHNIADTTKDSQYWTAENLAQSMVGLWFGATHQPWMFLYFTLSELCLRPEWISRLRAELDVSSSLEFTYLNSLPLLDGFIKEVARYNPVDQLSIRRKALKTHRFSDDGPTVPEGHIVAAPMKEIMHDPSNYANPHMFLPERFIDAAKATGKERSKLTDVSDTFLVWGFGSRVCPGRLHASFVIKLILAHILQTYDFELQDSGRSTYFHWDTFKVPQQSTVARFRKREGK